MSTVAEIIAKELKKAGVEYAFGVSGETLIPLMDAFRKTGIEFILTRHETGAGFMADAVHQLTGKPVVLLATQGPGITNLVNAAAHAFLDRSSLIVITSSIPLSQQNVVVRQNLPHEEILNPVTKYTATIRGTDAAQVVTRAIEAATSERPGPVYLNLPVDVAKSEYTGPDGFTSVTKLSFTPLGTGQFNDFTEKLRNAKRPIAIVGNGANKSSSVTREWLEKWKIPSLSTYRAKGILDESTTLSLGPIGLSKVSDQVQQSFIKQSDLILTIGFDPAEISGRWLQTPTTEVMRINIDSVPALRGYLSPHEEYVGEIGLFLQSTMPAETPSNNEWSNEELDQHRQNVKNSLAMHASIEGLSPYKLTEVLREVMPKNTIVTADTGSHRITASQVWDCYEPLTFLQSIGLATMGYALPAAIGAKFISRDSPVLCLVGDAGFEMILGELGMLKQLNLPIVIVVFADRALSRIKIDQEQEGYQVYGTEFETPEYTTIAKAYGGEGVIVRSLDEIQAAAEEALNRDVFTVIQAEIDPTEYVNQM
ncbi:thiamine pyrophosphate-binding protein [Bacillus carboniphilus]|uniref:thiamine pyrophosphate-binding protein n=1 Tax=Bacillus carboniphilus TaxID=86663 RepID=UPI0031DD4EF5